MASPKKNWDFTEKKLIILNNVNDYQLVGSI
jgi:hypothetical protein